MRNKTKTFPVAEGSPHRIWCLPRRNYCGTTVGRLHIQFTLVPGLSLSLNQVLFWEFLLKVYLKNVIPVCFPLLSRINALFLEYRPFYQETSCLKEAFLKPKFNIFSLIVIYTELTKLMHTEISCLNCVDNSIPYELHFLCPNDFVKYCEFNSIFTLLFQDSAESG